MQICNFFMIRRISEPIEIRYYQKKKLILQKLSKQKALFERENILAQNIKTSILWNASVTVQCADRMVSKRTAAKAGNAGIAVSNIS